MHSFRVTLKKLLVKVHSQLYIHTIELVGSHHCSETARSRYRHTDGMEWAQTVYLGQKSPHIMTLIAVCVCVCVRERERTNHAMLMLGKE